MGSFKSNHNHTTHLEGASDRNKMVPTQDKSLFLDQFYMALHVVQSVLLRVLAPETTANQKLLFNGRFNLPE